MNDLLSAILIIEGKNKIFFLPTYLPIGQIVESERGNKQHFKLGLMSIAPVVIKIQFTPKPILDMI
jgi:hypothetical protein